MIDTQKKVCEIMIPLMMKYHDTFDEAANFVFKMETEKGIPHKLTLDKLKDAGYTKDGLLMTLSRYQELETQHSLDSGMNAKNLEKRQKSNRDRIIEMDKLGSISI